MKISNSQYAKILYSMVDGKDESQVKSAVSDFSRFLIKKRSSKKLDKIVRNFSKIWNTENNIIDCEVYSAEPVLEENMKKIETHVKERYDASSVNLKNIIKREIKGGVMIKIGDEILDASIEGQLKRLKKQLVS